MPLYLYRSFHSYHAYQLRKDTLMAMPSSVEQLKFFFFLIWKGSVGSSIVWLCHSTCVSLIVTSWSNFQGNVLYLVLTLYYVFHEWVLQKYLKKNYKFWSDLYPDSSEARDLDVRVAGQVGSSHIVWSLQAHTRLSVSDPAEQLCVSLSLSLRWRTVSCLLRPSVVRFECNSKQREKYDCLLDRIAHSMMFCKVLYALYALTTIKLSSSKFIVQCKRGSNKWMMQSSLSINVHLYMYKSYMYKLRYCI